MTEVETTTDDRGVSVTLKAGTAFSAPWVVVRAGSIEEAGVLLEDEEKVKNLLNIAARAGVAFQGIYRAAAGGLAGEVTEVQNTPQAAPQAPAQGGLPGPVCQHGAMVQRSGNKNGRAWTGYFCPTPKGTPDQCPPQFGK